MGHDTLGNVFKTNFSLMHHHKWSMSDIEALVPWERYIYVEMLQQFLEELEKEKQQREQEMKAKLRQAERRK